MLALLGLMLAVFFSQLHLSTTKDMNQEISVATTQFSVDLLKSMIHDGPRNMVISPVSMYSLLSILQQGARGNSRQEINKVLHAPSNNTMEGYHNLTSNIEESDSTPALRFMCKARIKGSHHFIPAFKQALVKGFKTRFYSVKQAHGKSNVGNKTRTSPSIRSYKGIFSKIVLPNRASRQTFTALANQLYLNGLWATMDLSETSILFSPTSGEKILTEGVKMKRFCFTGVTSELGAKWIHLPLAIQRKSERTDIKPSGNYWSRRKISMMFILPTERHGLDNLVERLKPEHIINFINYSNKDKKFTELTLPKFQINTTTNFIPYLKKLGLNDVFQRSSDLSGISTQQQLYVSKALQMGQITVDYYGVRTSTLTEINFPYAYDDWGEPQPFSVDEPFLFFIVDSTNHLPLFVGRVTQPTPNTLTSNNEEEFQVPV